jgi:hypothetical protein
MGLLGGTIHLQVVITGKQSQVLIAQAKAAIMYDGSNRFLPAATAGYDINIFKH